MRISTGYQFETYTNNIQKAQSTYFKVQKQIATGRQFESASEDPLLAHLSMNSRQLKMRFEQYDKNLRNAKDYLGNSEQALGEISDLLNQASVFAIQGASSALDPSAAQSLADQVDALQDKLVRLGNKQGSQGQYIFAGQKSNTKPFTEIGTTLQFNGDDLPILAEVRSSEYIRVNGQGMDVAIANVYNELETLKANLQSHDIIKLSDESVANLKTLRDQIVGLRSNMGARLQNVQQLETENTRRIDDLTAEISGFEEVDITEAYVRYQQAENAYSAALQVASQGMGLSLMDFMR